MSLNFKKALAILVIAVFMTTLAGLYIAKKNAALTAVYSGVYYSRIAAEGRQCFWHMEELLRRGADEKSVGTLQQICQTSSYIKGAGIYSIFHEFQYVWGDMGNLIVLSQLLSQMSDASTTDYGGWCFVRQGDNGWIVLEQLGGTAGVSSLIIQVNVAALENSSADVRLAACQRTAILFAELGLAAILLVAAVKRNYKHMILRFAGLLLVTVLLSCGIDSGLELARLHSDLSGMARQSANQVVQRLDKQKEAALAGEEGYLFMEDVNSSLRRATQDTPFIQSIYPGIGGVLRANYDEDYVWDNLRKAATAMLIPFYRIHDWLPTGAP